MNCIIVDDEPLAREAVEDLLKVDSGLFLLASFNSAVPASMYMMQHRDEVDLVFLDIQMPDVSGIDFAKSVPDSTLVIFTTAYSEFAVESYEVNAVDYLVKPIEEQRFRKAVEKAINYHALLANDKNDIESFSGDYFFVKSERRYFKVYYTDILFVEGLKDYVIIQTADQRIITKINLKNIGEKLPEEIFMRVSKSYIVNLDHIDSFDNNDIYMKSFEIAIGNSYRDSFFDGFVTKMDKI